jgi:DNA repair protein RadC
MKSDKIKNWPVKERPRERLIAEGAERQSDADLLAIILRVGRGTFKEGVLGQNAPDFARELLKEFKGLRGLDRAHIEDLKKVPGIGIAKAAQIKAAFELGKRVQSKRLTSLSFESSSAVAAHFRPRYVNARQEIAIAILLNGQNQLWLEPMKHALQNFPLRRVYLMCRMLMSQSRWWSKCIIVFSPKIESPRDLSFPVGACGKEEIWVMEG